jgi:hypothetical protein
MRQHNTGACRYQLRVSSLEDIITADNTIRFIEAFVGNIAKVPLLFMSLPPADKW